MNSLPLFDRRRDMIQETGGVPRIETPAARTTDPVTSHMAADEVTASGRRAAQQSEVLAAVRRHNGMTSAELARLAGMDRYAIARRLPELEPQYVTKGPARQCHESGRMAVTWWAAT